MVAEGLTVDEFYDWLKADLEEDPASNNSFVVSGCRGVANLALHCIQPWLLTGGPAAGNVGLRDLHANDAASGQGVQA